MHHTLFVQNISSSSGEHIARAMLLDPLGVFDFHSDPWIGWIPDNVRVKIAPGCALPIAISLSGSDVPGVLVIRESLSDTKFVCDLHMSRNSVLIQPGVVLNRTSVWLSNDKSVRHSTEVATILKII